MTDWFFFGVLFHDKYRAYPEIWRQAPADVIGRRAAASEGQHRLVDAANDVGRAAPQMGSYELKSSVGAKLPFVAVGCLRNPIGQQHEGSAAVQWYARTGGKPTAGEEA
jgi:hypothetical protein